MNTKGHIFIVVCLFVCVCMFFGLLLQLTEHAGSVAFVVPPTSTSFVFKYLRNDHTVMATTATIPGATHVIICNVCVHKETSVAHPCMIHVYLDDLLIRRLCGINPNFTHYVNVQCTNLAVQRTAMVTGHAIKVTVFVTKAGPAMDVVWVMWTVRSYLIRLPWKLQHRLLSHLFGEWVRAPTTILLASTLHRG
jgi:preprotein translocase subunit SecG